MAGMVGNLEKAVAGKMNGQKLAPNTTPPGWTQGKKTGWGGKGMPPGQAKKAGKPTFYVEGERQVVGPYQTAKAAAGRTARETQVYNQGGFNKGKAPEMTEKPAGSNAVARFPNGRRVPRVPPAYPGRGGSRTMHPLGRVMTPTGTTRNRGSGGAH